MQKLINVKILFKTAQIIGKYNRTILTTAVCTSGTPQWYIKNMLIQIAEIYDRFDAKDNKSIELVDVKYSSAASQKQKLASYADNQKFPTVNDSYKYYEGMLASLVLSLKDIMSTNLGNSNACGISGISDLIQAVGEELKKPFDSYPGTK